MMNLEISYEPDTEQVTIVYDNAMTMTARVDSNGYTRFSKSFDNIVDDDIYDVLKDFCNNLLTLKK